MKLEINIEKKHAMAIILAVVLVSAANFVFAPTAGQQYHTADELWINSNLDVNNQNLTNVSTIVFADGKTISSTSGGVPSGAIIMWSGTLASIPEGWVLCDGTTGTPNLTERFVYGVSLGENPGLIGGTIEHDHGIGSHTHIIDPPSTTTSAAGSVKRAYGSGDRAAPAGHTHSVDIAPFESASASGVTASTNHLPPFYKIAFICKV